MKRKKIDAATQAPITTVQPNEPGLNTDPIGRVLMLLGFEPKKTVLDNVMHLLNEALDNTDSSISRVISDRLALTNVEWEEALPEVIDSLSGNSSPLSPKLQGTIDAISNLLFAKMGIDGRLTSSSKPGMSDYVKLISFFKRIKRMKGDRDINVAPTNVGTRSRSSIFD